MPFNQDQPFPAGGTVTPVVQTGFAWWGLLETFMVFLIILFAALWIIRRLNRSSLQSVNTSWARVLDRQMLSGQQSLYLVEVAGKLQVLGGSDHHLSKISEINDPELAAEILEEIATRPVERVEGWAKGIQKLWQRPKQNKEHFSEELERLLEEVEE